MKIAVVASLLGNFHANPSLRYAAFRPELQVIQMLDGRLRRKKMKEYNIVI
jgi:hypothetical protein